MMMGKRMIAVVHDHGSTYLADPERAPEEMLVGVYGPAVTVGQILEDLEAHISQSRCGGPDPYQLPEAVTMGGRQYRSMRAIARDRAMGRLPLHSLYRKPDAVPSALLINATPAARKWERDHGRWPSQWSDWSEVVAIALGEEGR